MASLTVKESASGVLRFHLWVSECVKAVLGQCSEVLSHHAHQHFPKQRNFLPQFGSFSLSSQHFIPFISVRTAQIIYSYCTSADVMRIRAPVTVILINITPACFLSDQFTAKYLMLLKIWILPVLKHNLDHFGLKNSGGTLGYQSLGLTSQLQNQLALETLGPKLFCM